jgi:hypothetical protein
MDFRKMASTAKDDDDVIVSGPSFTGVLPKVEWIAWKDAVNSQMQSKRSTAWQAKAKEQFKFRIAAKHLKESSWSKYWSAWREAMRNHVAILQARQSAHN